MRLTEKYRPKNFDEICGQDDAIREIKNVLSRNEPIHFIFDGQPGVGKTSTAECIARYKFGDTWQYHYKEFNASDERGIDMVRNILKRLAFIKGDRVILLDEADRLTDEAQDALRRPLEKTTGTMFIFNVNHSYKIIDAIKSRCVIIPFNRLSNDVVKKRLFEIMKAEQMKATFSSEEEKEQIKKGINYLIETANGDLRKAINTLEKIVNEEKQITITNIVALQKPKIALNAMLNAIGGNFEKAKNDIEEAYINNHYSYDEIIRELYEGITEENIKDRDLRIRLFIEIKELEKACKLGTNPIYQLVGFIAKAYLFPHLPKGCPVLTQEQ
jgi:DNA polymerase III delta prime subunit